MSRPSKKKNQPNQTNFFDTQDILMNAPIGVFTSTPDGPYIAVNQATAEKLGYENPQVLNKKIIPRRMSL